MTKTYYPKGVCSRKMDIDVDDGIIKNVTITGGCNGNLQGIAALVKGRKVEEVIDILKGIRCGMRSTSCPDQLAKALTEIVKEA